MVVDVPGTFAVNDDVHWTFLDSAQRLDASYAQLLVLSILVEAIFYHSQVASSSGIHVEVVGKNEADNVHPVVEPLDGNSTGLDVEADFSSRVAEVDILEVVDHMDIHTVLVAYLEVNQGVL